MVSDWFASNPVGLTSKQYVSVLSGIAAILSDISMNITDVTAGCWYTTSKFIGDHFTSGILAHRNEHFYFFLSERRMRIKITFYIEMTQEFLDGFLMRIKDLVNFEQCT